MLSLDVLRGLDLAFMILVNNNGDWNRAYWPLKHAEWNGFTPTDLVFPTFLFLVGVSTVFSTDSRLAQGVSKASLFLHILWRTGILLLLGFLINTYPHFHFSTMRFYGVLPRIAVCYCIVATLYLLSPGWRSKLALAVGALAGYWLLMRFVPVPGFGLPGRDIPINHPDGNLTAWLDRQIFSPVHLYEGTRDPEGLLSTIPAVATALMGMLTGCWLRSGRTLVQKTRGIAIAGASCVLLGGLWNLSFPINKKLWTSSFVLFAGGWSLLLLAASIWAVDLLGRPKGIDAASADQARRKRRFMPLLVFGSNAIAAYVISELLPGTLSFIHIRRNADLGQWYYEWLLKAIHDVPFASLLFSLTFVVVCWIPVYLLYRKRIFIKI
jgi:predicted acyltransferase